MPLTVEPHERQQVVRESWFLTGATATGKTSIGLALAARLDAEILALDSMSIYRGMDVGTAKPSPEQQSQIDHHLIDIVDPDTTFSVADYCELAWQQIADVRSRGKQVLFVGGTPLYLKSMLRGLFDGPPADWTIRKEIEHEVETHGLEVLRKRLELVDPLSAHKLHPNDKRRMIRALEVYRQTGQPISHHQREFEEGMSSDQCRVFALQWPRSVLHERIENRVNRMFEQGLVAEVAGLLDRFGSLSRTAEQAVGYREVIAHLRSAVDLDSTIESVKTRTRQFARRQETWFRGLSECSWQPMSDSPESESIVDQILQSGKSGASMREG